MKLTTIYAKASTAIAAGVFVASQSAIVVAATDAPAIEKKEASPPPTVAGAASAKNSEIKKTKPHIAVPNAKQQRPAGPSDGSPVSIPIVTGPIGPPPKGDDLKPKRELKTPVAPTASGKKALPSPTTNNLKADINKTVTPSPALDMKKDIPKQ
jgi:hypothetical protein